MDDLEISAVPCVLMAKGLWKFVDGSTEGATAEDKDKFEAEQQKAFLTIVMSAGL